MKHRSIPSLGLLVPALALLASLMAVSAENPADHTVVIPYDATYRPSDQNPEQFYLEYAAFERLWDLAKETRRREADEDYGKAATPKDYAISSGLYRAAIEKGRLAVEARLSLLTRGGKWMKVPMNFAGAPIRTITLDGKPASLQGGALVIEEPGSHRLDVVLDVALPNEWKTATWRIPQAAGSMVSVSTSEPGARIEINGGLPLSESRPDLKSERRIFTAALGTRSEIVIERSTKAEIAAGERPSVARIDARLAVTEAMERLSVSTDFEFSGGERSAFEIAFHRSVTPVSFTVPNLKSWTLGDADEDGMRVLSLQLARRAKDRLTVRMTGERRLAQLPATNRAFPRLSADASRLEIRRTLVRGGRVEVQANAGREQRQAPVDAAEELSAGLKPVAAFVTDDETAPLTYGVDWRATERRAVVDYVFQAGRRKLELVANVVLKFPEGETVATTAMGLPVGAIVEGVEGDRLKEWWRDGDTLHARFTGGAFDETTLLVSLVREFDEEPAEIDLEPLTFPDFSEVEGSAVVAAHVTTDTLLRFPGADPREVREVDPESVSRDFGILPPLERKRGFRFETGTFTAKLALTELTPKFSASWIMLARAQESRVGLSIYLDLELTQSAIDRAQFTLPEAVPEVRVTSDEVREVQSEVADGVRTYTVEFQRYITDAIGLVIETEIAHAGEVALPALEVIGAQRTERYLVVENRSIDDMKVETENAAPVPVDSLPFRPDALASAQLFRASPGWSAAVAMKKLETTAGNEAVVLLADLTSALRANGKLWGKAQYRLQNRSLQFLPVVLDPAAELVSARVAGEPVRADRGLVDDREVLLIPLIQTKPGETAYDVELIYRKNGGPDLTGKPGTRPGFKVKLDDPELIGVVVERTLWTVYLPQGYVLSESEGNMHRIGAEGTAVEKVEGQLSELKKLNWLMRSTGVSYEFKKEAAKNAELLAQQLESAVSQFGRPGYRRGGSADDSVARQVSGLQSQLREQQVLVTENRIVLADDEKKRAPEETGEAGRKGSVAWVENNDRILTRNKKIEDANTAQDSRLRDQFRVNDNIAIGNGIFNNFGVNRVEEANVAGQQLLQEDMNDWNGAEAAIRRYDGLNVSQNNRFFQAGDMAVNVAGGAQTADNVIRREIAPQANLPPSNIQPRMDQQAQQQQPQLQQEALVTRRSASQGYFNRWSNARTSNSIEPASQVDPAQGLGMPTILGRENVDAFGNVEPNFVAPPKFKPSGRTSIPVDFPLAGNAYHFRKAKDHAVVEITAQDEARFRRLEYLAWLAGALVVLIIVERISAGMHRRRRSRDRAATAAATS